MPWFQVVFNSDYESSTLCNPNKEPFCVIVFQILRPITFRLMIIQPYRLTDITLHIMLLNSLSDTFYIPLIVGLIFSQDMFRLFTLRLFFPSQIFSKAYIYAEYVNFSERDGYKLKPYSILEYLLSNSDISQMQAVYSQKAGLNNSYKFNAFVKILKMAIRTNLYLEMKHTGLWTVCVSIYGKPFIILHSRHKNLIGVVL